MTQLHSTPTTGTEALSSPASGVAGGLASARLRTRCIAVVFPSGKRQSWFSTGLGLDLGLRGVGVKVVVSLKLVRVRAMASVAL